MVFESLSYLALISLCVVISLFVTSNIVSLALFALWYCMQEILNI